MISDFEEIKFEYRCLIESFSNHTCYQSKQVFDSYESAWSYLRLNIPNGFEGYVISLPKIDINLEADFGK